MRQHRDRLVKLWLAVLVAVALSGCGKTQPAESGYREIGIGMSVTDSGIVTTYPEPLQFVDFASKESVVLCSEPDCDHQWHSDNDYCPAFEQHGHPFVYNEELYFFRDETYRDSDTMHIVLIVLWNIIIKNRFHIIHVNTARRHIRCN